MDSIANATDGALASVESANLELETVCPNVQAEDIETVVGFDLNALITSVTDEYEDTVADARAEIAYYRDWIALLEDGVLSFEDSVDKAKEWLWVVPGIICAVSIVTVASMVGVLLAWKERSGRRIQAFLSYGLLPIMMVVAVLCWIIVCVSAFGTMVGADVCTASGAPNGSPDETFQQVLDVLFPDHDDTAYTMIQSYTNVSVLSLGHQISEQFLRELLLVNRNALGKVLLQQLTSFKLWCKTQSPQSGDKFPLSVLLGARRS